MPFKQQGKNSKAEHEENRQFWKEESPAGVAAVNQDIQEDHRLRRIGRHGVHISNIILLGN